MHFDYSSPLRLSPSTAGVTVEEHASLRVRPGPSFHDDPDGAGLFPSLGESCVPHSPAFVLQTGAVKQIGYRGYLSGGNEFFTDEALVNADEEQRFVDRIGQQSSFPNEDTGLIPAHETGRFTFDARSRPVIDIDGETLCLCSFEPSNYGAFLFRVLPKLAGRRHLLKSRAVLAPLYNQAMRDLFAMAGVPVERIVAHNTHAIYRLKTAIIPSLRNTHALLDAETLAFYAALRDRYGTRRGARKIFVSRLGWTESHAATHRVMRNEEQLARRLAAEGFAVIRPHNMSSRQQIEAFSAADVIVGASGSAMFNVVFSRPGTRLIDIESEPHWIFAHTNLFGSCGLDYGILEAKAIDQDWGTAHKPFSVNVDALMTRITSST
ncbi:glycosyltransferase 61 family protein [Variovorax sp. J22G21]|uniref:glycosyltransferase family 61 protein n=1 Tax=Variovorax fucosicus TaxID=3053517 RepID=UPI0025760474|nr:MULTISPECIES: glycosyltransferase 61 family protein [unclassified Variovorax]MDM0038515.1 glycosyltransferase 61 family protein [Variovorax sp. J22R193]MDM0055815.1 glycosyltransferase 61 family protein [Variovorax sp. J22G47]MDM0063291.1 glycosyltransferase 61 family protein [Variovorax sp. J22G21]